MPETRLPLPRAASGHTVWMPFLASGWPATGSTCADVVRARARPRSPLRFRLAGAGQEKADIYVSLAETTALAGRRTCAQAFEPFSDQGNRQGVRAWPQSRVWLRQASGRRGAHSIGARKTKASATILADDDQAHAQGSPRLPCVSSATRLLQAGSGGAALEPLAQPGRSC